MTNARPRLDIAHLYPSELGINGDVGNVTALVFRARAYEVDVRVTNVSRGEELPADIDLVHIGSGPTEELKLVLSDISRLAPELRALRDAGIPFLAISAGWFALGESVAFSDGIQASGAGVFPSSVKLLKSRVVGEIALETSWGIVTGFENHSALVDPSGLSHFGRVREGVGSDPNARRADRWEGVVMGASIGTNVHGPLLPMNPVIADSLIESAIQRTRPDWKVPTAQLKPDAISEVDGFAANSREAVLKRL